jgi:hypothetical protein
LKFDGVAAAWKIGGGTSVEAVQSRWREEWPGRVIGRCGGKEGGRVAWHDMAVNGQPERRNWGFGDELGENGCGIAEMDVGKEWKG